MAITGSILVPIRFIGAILVLFLAMIWARIAIIGLNDPSAKPYSPLRRRVIFLGFRMLSRLLLFCYGYIWIDTISHESTEPHQHAVPKVVVCNHTGFVELLYLAYAYGCCFVAKGEIKHLPFMGWISQAMQCIFVDRTSAGASNTSHKIRERMHADPGLWPLLAIAPEGTTTNGHVLIHFLTGAFRPGQPVLPIATEMPYSPSWGYDPSFSCVNMTYHILGLMSQPWNRLTVHHLAVYEPSEAEKNDAQLFANNVREQIAKVINVPSYELQWRDKLLVDPTSEKKRDLGRQMFQKNGGVIPVAPVFSQDVFGNEIGSKFDTHAKEE